MKTMSKYAHKPNRDMIKEGIDGYEKCEIKNFKTALNAAVALALPMANTPQKVTEFYQKAMGKTTLKRKQYTRQKQDYTLKILLFTHTNKRKPGDEEEDAKRNKLGEADKNKYRKYLTKKYPNHQLFRAGYLNVSMGSDNFFDEVKDKLITRPDKKNLKALYDTCKTDDNS